MWYKNAIIYQLHVRSFADGNGDGIGDFAGLISRLEHIERLGITAIWLLPFYPSPLRDDGYDIADYCAIHPDYGTLADFRRFLREAHRRGLRVITELVLNHTSDQHAWFQKARRSPPGSAPRDYYVWSHTSDRYPQARIIFQDFESSNWTWDPVARAHFWHRFYSHQPDLNFENPRVQRELLKVLDFWLDMGVDGLRLDAVPYLFEREGTNCENLPETHQFLKKLRAHVDARHPGRMLLAEANQWPEDAVAYFGNGDECHMAFHFPIMPRIFMSLWMEDRNPLLDILEQTPPIPETCQWALFLRNHDELTLEMVSDEERDYMYRAYARDSRARINLGIRRRLAPLMQNNRRKLEVINFLLLSFPGTPIIYYGDEIGMGDNYYLGDRNGVRTPMQWSSDRNAGFSRANPQRLCLPVIIDPEFHYEVVNVENQEANQSSLLWWMRRLLATYKRLPALGQGSLDVVPSENPKVLSLLRSHGQDKVLVVVNLSRFAQVTELGLADHAGLTPVEAFGNAAFPAITHQPYIMTLGPHEHFWLRLETPAENVDIQPPVALPMESCRRPFLELLEPPHGREIAVRLLAGGLPLRDFRAVAVMDLPAGPLPSALVLADCALGQEIVRPRLLALSWLAGERLSALETRNPVALLARAECGGQPGTLCDGFADDETLMALARRMDTGGRNSHDGWMHLEVLDGAKPLLPAEGAGIRVVGRSARTLTFVAGNALFIKVFLQPEDGPNPEVEMGRILADGTISPRLHCALSHQSGRGEPMILAVAHEFASGCTNGLAYVREALDTFFERTLAAGRDEPAAVAPAMDGEYVLDFFRRLGAVLGALHGRLLEASGQTFAPQPFSKLYVRSVYQSLRNLTRQAGQALARQRPQVVLPEKALLDRFARIRELESGGLRLRIHGDFELENILFRGKDILVVDFDGDVRLSLGERRIRRSALRDAASMLVSLRLSAALALKAWQADRPTEKPQLASGLGHWLKGCEDAFMHSYADSCAGKDVLPQAASCQALLEIFMLERLLRKLTYELEDGRELTQDILEVMDALLGTAAVAPTPPED